MGDGKSYIERQGIAEKTTTTPLATLFTHIHPMSLRVSNATSTWLPPFLAFVCGSAHYFLKRIQPLI